MELSGRSVRITGSSIKQRTWAAISAAGDRIAVDPAGNPWVSSAIRSALTDDMVLIPGSAGMYRVGPMELVCLDMARGWEYQILTVSGNSWIEFLVLQELQSRLRIADFRSRNSPKQHLRRSRL